MKQWYALRSKQKKESSAGALLAKAGIEVYIPEVRVHKQHGKPPVLEPFFPGYLFSRLDPLLGEIRLANYTSGILHVVGFGDQPCPVPDSLILYIKERLMRGGAGAARENLSPGERVVITSGPLEGVQAIFDCHLSPTGRVRVLIQMLERLCRTELHVGQLRRAREAAGEV